MAITSRTFPEGRHPHTTAFQNKNDNCNERLAANASLIRITPCDQNMLRANSLAGNPLAHSSIDTFAPLPTCLSPRQSEENDGEFLRRCLRNTSLDGSCLERKISPCLRPVREHSLSGNPLTRASTDVSLSQKIFTMDNYRK